MFPKTETLINESELLFSFRRNMLGNQLLTNVSTENEYEENWNIFR